MVSTRNSAGCPLRSIAARTSATRLVTPVEVSLCTIATALTACSRSSASRAATASGSTPWRQSPGITSTCKPSRVASRTHRLENCPVSAISTRSPGESVLTSAASHAPVPEAGKITTGRSVPNTGPIERSMSPASRTNSGPRWSMVARSIARSTRSGTLVGPGICKKWRPLWNSGNRRLLGARGCGRIVRAFPDSFRQGTRARRPDTGPVCRPPRARPTSATPRRR